MYFRRIFFLNDLKKYWRESKILFYDDDNDDDANYGGAAALLFIPDWAFGYLGGVQKTQTGLLDGGGDWFYDWS